MATYVKNNQTGEYTRIDNGPINGGSAYGGTPRYSGGTTIGTGTTNNPYKKKAIEETTITIQQPAPTINTKTTTTPATRTPTYAQEPVSRISYAQQVDIATKGMGGYSIPASTYAGEGKDYIGYTVENPPIEPGLVSSQYPKANFQARVQELGRSIFRHNEPPIIKNIDGTDYIVRDTSKGTIFGTEAPLQPRPELAKKIRTQGLGYEGATYTYIGRGLIRSPVTRSNPNYAEQITRGGASRVVENPRGAILGGMTAYAIGGIVGGTTGALVTKQGAIITAKYGLPTAIKATTATSNAILGGGAILGTAYIATTKPTKIGEQLPEIIGGAAGFSKGYSTYARPPLEYGGTTNKYLGIEQSMPKTSPKTTMSMNNDLFSLSATKTRGAIYYSYNKPINAKILEEGYATGTAIANTPEGNIYDTKILSRRTAIINTKPTTTTISNEIKGNAIINIPKGTSYNKAPGYQSIGFIKETNPLTSGKSRISTGILAKNKGTYEFTGYNNIVTSTQTKRKKKK